MYSRPTPVWLAILGGALGVLAISTLAPGLANAQDGEPQSAYEEKEAQSIDRMLLCPVCPAQTIDQAQVPVAQQMRNLVREMLSQGATRREILDFFADRYGDDVLAAPPKSGINLLAWFLPVIGIAAALGAGFVVLKAMAARRPSEAPLVLPNQEGLEPYLETVDHDLGLLGSVREDPQPGNSGAREDGGGTSGAEADGVEITREDNTTRDG